MRFFGRVSSFLNGLRSSDSNDENNVSKALKMISGLSLIKVIFPLVVIAFFGLIFLSFITSFNYKMNILQLVDSVKILNSSENSNSNSESADNNNNNNRAPIVGGKGALTVEQRRSIVDAAYSQIGVPYCSMTYSPNGAGPGFGCAMFVSYTYNIVLFNGARGDDWNTSGFYGSTYEYWGNVTNDGYNPHNKNFVEVSAEEAQPGDVVAYTDGSDPYSSYSSCGHVALYIGNGRIIGAWGAGCGSIGQVDEGTVESQAYTFGGGMRQVHYLRYVG